MASNEEVATVPSPELELHILDDALFNSDENVSPIAAPLRTTTPLKGEPSMPTIDPPPFAAFKYEEDVTPTAALQSG